MKEIIISAIGALQRTSGDHPSVTFTHKLKNAKKNVSARIQYDESGKPIVSVTNSSGYNLAYIKSKVKANFQEVINAEAPYATSGDIVLTRKFVSNPPAPGTVVNLSGSDYYYSVNGGIISCNGQQFGNGFQGRFQRLYTATCIGGSAIMDYTEFQLL